MFVARISPAYRLDVRSTPITCAGITCDKPGATRHYFLYWMVDNGPRPEGQHGLQLTMDGDHAASAIYDCRLEGDSNDDNEVNLLDIIHVRERLYTRCEE